MSSYFYFTIEKPQKDGSYHVTERDHYDEENDVLNPYILKYAFFDNYAFRGGVNSLTDLTDETKMHFSHKIERIGSVIGLQSCCSDENYPYNYKSDLLIEGENKKTDNFLETLVNHLEHISETSLQKFNDFRVEIDVDVVNEHLNDLVFFFKLDFKKDVEFSKYKEFKEKLIADKDIVKYCNPKGDFYINNLIFDSNGCVWLEFDGTYDALIHLRNVTAMNKIENIVNEMLTGRYGFVTYKNGNQEVLQFKINGSVYYSSQDDVIALKNKFEKWLDLYQKRHTVEMMAKRMIKEFLDERDSSYDEKKSDLYKALKKFIGKSNYEYEDEDYEEELKQNIDELETLIKLIGPKGRLIWQIA